MSSDNIINMAAHRHGAGLPAPVIDLWELATTGETANGRFALGMELAEVAHFISQHPNAENLKDVGIPGHRYWDLDNKFVLNFDERNLLEGIYYDGNHSNEISLRVKEAVARRNWIGDIITPADGCELMISDHVPVRLRNSRLDHFATLPRFLGTLHDVDTWQHQARGQEKWLQCKIETEHGRLSAEFVLSAFLTPYVEHFNIDYCLLGFGFMKVIATESENIALSSAD